MSPMTDTLDRPADGSAARTTRRRTTPPPGTGPREAREPRETRPVAGVLDIDRGGQGRLRRPDLLPRPEDPQVSPAQIRAAGLRKGDVVQGLSGRRPGALGEILRVGGEPAPVAADAANPVNAPAAPGACDAAGDPRPSRAVTAGPRPHFGELTPVHPHERLRLESASLKGSGALAGRLIDLMAPIGKGQRGLIVAPPKAGKTVLLQSMAAAVAANHPECHLMVLLLDERPEEVTEMRRAVRGEVIASTFDQPAKQHLAVADLAVERAKRLVERGQDVVILLDSLTRLCRAFNTAAAGSGRTLSGGVDAAALAGPKRLFGAARSAEEGGSLTVVATALTDTGSRADDFYYEELKGTGNMELRLDRALAERRIYPCVDIAASGTRREELLLSAAELPVSRGLRRALHGRDAQSGLEVLLDRFRQSPDNAAFVHQVRGTLPAAG